MAILKVARMGHPVLRETCRPIDPAKIAGPEVQRLIRDMLETMFEYNGVGLAAPQVYTPVRLVIAGGEQREDGGPLLRVLINPEITVLDETRREGMYEGCLSIPGWRGYVERPAHIRVKALDEAGKPLDLELEGYPAIVMQHECDHLDGILYVDRVEDHSKLGFEEEIQRYHDLAAPDDADDADEDD
ncbi:MAG TPA: peptide deformylase [Candidatus Krumholzibacteria bacterium]|nr:peptide deformylase [Candidatus Krumholzibacteria bacterium]HPD72879.1 peptide deformylase [Candidatus Krumholzibacteria bacterium]HRY41678.1 peptide deformylase [Candidatus Krumholzibacteria bacterium]